MYAERGSRMYASGGGRRGRSPVRSAGRTCAADGCTTILSTYNHSEYCGVHERTVVRHRQHRRSRPPQPVLERLCPHCDDVFETTNPRRRFCSDACRIASWQRNQRAAAG
jgi:hypothetical protein